MGLVLSAIVVCVGIAEVLDCWHHFLLHIVQPQYNPLPYHLESKSDIRNERDLNVLVESRRTSNIDICWPKDISPNDDLHVIKKRTHSESDRTVAHDIEQSCHIRLHEDTEALTSPNNAIRSSPQITIHDLEPNDQLRIVSPLMRTELSPDHLSLDVIVESDSSSELDEPSQIENLAYRKKIEESLKTISKVEDSAEETGELSRITEQYCNEPLVNQPPRPSCPSSLSKEGENCTAYKALEDIPAEASPLLEFTGNILASGVQQVPCRYSDNSLAAITISSSCNDVITNEGVNELANASNTLLECQTDLRENKKSSPDRPDKVQTVESILDEGLDPIPEFPEIRLHESSPVPAVDSSDSSLDTSDASWIAKGKTSDRPLIIRLPQFKDINSENKKSHKNSKKDQLDKDIYYDAEDTQPIEIVIPNRVNANYVIDQPADSIMRCELKESFNKDQTDGVAVSSSSLGFENNETFEKGDISFGDCVPNSDRLHNLQRDTNSSSSSLSGIPQLPEDMKDYSTETPLPTDNGFDIDQGITEYESTHNTDDQSSLGERICLEEGDSPIAEDNKDNEHNDHSKKIVELPSVKVDRPEGNMVLETDNREENPMDGPGNSYVSTTSLDNITEKGASFAKKHLRVDGERDNISKHLFTNYSSTEVVESKPTDVNPSIHYSDSLSKGPLPPNNTKPTDSTLNSQKEIPSGDISHKDCHDGIKQEGGSDTVPTNHKSSVLSSKSSKDTKPISMIEANSEGIQTIEPKGDISSTTISDKEPKIAGNTTMKGSNIGKLKSSEGESSIKPEKKSSEECVAGSSKTSDKDRTPNTTVESKSTKQSAQSESIRSKPSTSRPTEDDPESKASWLIFSGEYTQAMNKDWHSGHFCCWQCDESLTGQRYVLRDEHPYCIKCYESVFANGCEECNKTIGIDSKDLSYKDKHWHEACFLCNKCRVSLVDKQFGSKLDKIFCGNCYDAQFASRCDGCGQIFKAGTKKMEYKTRQWHEPCFACCVCKSAIGTKSFIPREQEIYCATCYEEKFATRCVKCNKIITSGGVTYKNEPWHRECFTCTNCSTSLAGQRFTSRDEKPYCAECFGELFAKRCTACSKPITGIGGTRFISFEDRHWHNDCFICASCKTSLVGRGFITDADDIICPECAKQKLM